MQLFHFESTSPLKVGDEIMPVPLQEIRIGDKRLVERDLEDLIVQYPQLLNYGECDIASSDTADLLIVSRQSTTETGKKFDLLALDNEGKLVVIEIKRDAKDAKARREAFEFQAIRYAASCSKLTVPRVAEIFAKYLWRRENPNAEDGHYTSDEEAEYRRQAVKKICRHLSDGQDEDVSEEELPGLITPSKSLQVYLVAGDYDRDVLSACAWLKRNGVDIRCLHLRPYRVAEAYVLERDRLIPPPVLDDFLADVKGQGSAASPRATEGGHAPSIKPVRMSWGQEGHKEAFDCNSWKSFLEKCVIKALEEGLPIEKLPMKKRTADGTFKDFEADYPNTIFLERYQLYIDCKAGRKEIESWIGRIRAGLGKARGFISAELANGETIQP